MKPAPWKPTLLLASVVVFGALGLVFCANQALGERWFRDASYVTLVPAQWASWALLWALAWALDRVLDLVLDLLLPGSVQKPKT